MRSLCRATLTFGVIALMTSPALAQRGPFPGGGIMPGGGQGGGTALLRNRGVQEELKMKEDQIQKLEAVEREVREKMREETQKALAKVLNAEQLKRFQQIELQQTMRTRGPDIFLDAQVDSTLKLTADQKEKIKTISDDYRKDTAEVRKTAAGGGNFQEVFQKTEALRKESVTRATDVLTATQKSAWKDMTGAAFEMRFDGGRGRGEGGKPQKPRKPDRN